MTNTKTSILYLVMKRKNWSRQLEFEHVSRVSEEIDPSE